MNCGPTTAGGLVASVQMAGGVKLRVDCSVNPAAFVGQVRMSWLPLGCAFKYGSNGAEPTSATVYPNPAAIAVTPLWAAAGTDV